jgi:hypothetical protein
MNKLTDIQWRRFQDTGYLKLGKLLSDDELVALQQRIDDIMLGKVDADYENLLMQLDFAAARYEDIGVQSNGFKGATLDYRKIQGLESDPRFLAYLQHPLFKDICGRAYGENPVLCFRAMFMNKPANSGSVLPWHQDRWSMYDRDPQITVWTALDPATLENGCVHVIEGSHGKLLNPDHPSGFLTEEQIEEVEKDAVIVPLTLEAGEVVLLHNWLLHSSNVNKTGIPRRAFSVCYMDGETRLTATGEPVIDRNTVFGKDALDPNQLTA